ncbi:MAG: hypothetical protein ACW98Y_04540 [Candidatus Thorarchaeota archaeon]|jgi:hypothetical protein
MSQEIRDSELFERWSHHRTNYFTKLALLVITLFAISYLGYLFYILTESLLIVLLLSVGVLLIVGALYIIFTNPPTETI